MFALERPLCPNHEVCCIQLCNRTCRSSPSGPLKGSFESQEEELFRWKFSGKEVEWSFAAPMLRWNGSCNAVERMVSLGHCLRFHSNQTMALYPTFPRPPWITFRRQPLLCLSTLAVRPLSLSPPAVVFRLRVRGPKKYKFARFRRTRLPSLLRLMSFSNGLCRPWDTKVNMPLYRGQHVHVLWESRTITVQHFSEHRSELLHCFV